MESLQSIYENISSHFKLLYLYDIEKYSLSELKNLTKKLKNNEPLSPDQQKRYNQLEEISQWNIKDKLRKKKENKNSSKISSHCQAQISLLQQSNIWDPPVRRDNESTVDQTNYSIDETMYLVAPPTNYKQSQIKSGKIFGGAFMASFTLSCLTKEKILNVNFKIDPKRKESTISKQTLQELNLKSTNPALLVDNHKEKFRVSSENILGLSFLQNNKIIMQCNFRSEFSSFEMKYTQ